MPIDIVVATRNRGKLVEIREILADEELNLLFLNDFPEIGDIPEDGATFEENALIKARTVSKLTSRTAIGDDSGIVVNALNGRPGVHSARFAGENATDEQNNEKLIAELQGVPAERRSAVFVCVIAVAGGGLETTVRGECPGVILEEGRGVMGFGYDPLFFYPPAGKTFSEMDPGEKNKISHRYRALDKLKEKLRDFLAGLKDV